MDATYRVIRRQKCRACKGKGATIFVGLYHGMAAEAICEICGGVGTVDEEIDFLEALNDPQIAAALVNARQKGGAG